MRVVSYLHWFDRDIERGIEKARVAFADQHGVEANVIAVRGEDVETVRRLNGKVGMKVFRVDGDSGNVTLMRVEK